MDKHHDRYAELLLARSSPATGSGACELRSVHIIESDLIRMRTREGMKVAKANGRLRGKQPKLKPNQAKHLLELHDLGTYTQAELAELFGVGRSTVYRTLERMRPAPPEPERPFARLANPQTTGRA
jgi:hypothetical protein